MPINQELLEILACPSCKTSVDLVRDQWLVCSQCHRKYPIKDNIPVMLVEEGDRHVDTPVDELPDPGALG